MSPNIIITVAPNANDTLKSSMLIEYLLKFTFYLLKLNTNTMKLNHILWTSIFIITFSHEWLFHKIAKVELNQDIGSRYHIVMQSDRTL